MAALVVVNALGDVYDPDTGNLLGAAVLDGQPTPCLTSPALGQAGFGNTTIGVVATNAKLTREEANKLASMGHDGLAMAIRPCTPAWMEIPCLAWLPGQVETPFLPVLVAGARAAALAVVQAVRHGGGTV